jgi:predicted nucleic acid-binding protein
MGMRSKSVPGEVAVQKATLDTNVLQEHWLDQAKKLVVDELLRLAAQGNLDLAVTARIQEDVPSEPLASRIGELAELGIQETGSVARMGHWVLGRDHLGSDEVEKLRLQLESDRKKGDPRLPDWRDWDHLHAHMLQRRDVFLTWDKAILRLTTQLEQLGIRILTPEQFLSGCRTTRTRTQ